MKPLISYYGGKQRLASRIVQLIPQHTVYVEPFCGGAAVFFAKPWPKVSNTTLYREVLSDTNSDLINLYRCFQDKEKAERLIHRLQFTLYSRQEHALRKEATDNGVERAARFYCDIQMSFSSKLGAGWGTSVYSTNNASAWSRKIAGLSDFFERLCSVYIECEDALKVIKRWDSPQTFFYCDPPYPGADQGHYGGYTQDDFNALVSALDACKGSFLLSNYEQPGVPKSWERFEFSAYCSASRKGKTGRERDTTKKATELGDRKRTEIVWRRFNRVAARPEIHALYDSGKFDCFANRELGF